MTGASKLRYWDSVNLLTFNFASEHRPFDKIVLDLTIGTTIGILGKVLFNLFKYTEIFLIE